MIPVSGDQMTLVDLKKAIPEAYLEATGEEKFKYNFEEFVFADLDGGKTLADTDTVAGLACVRVNMKGWDAAQPGSIRLVFKGAENNIELKGVKYAELIKDVKKKVAAAAGVSTSSVTLRRMTQMGDFYTVGEYALFEGCEVNLEISGSA